MPKGIKGFQEGHKHSEETKRKISNKLSRKIVFDCVNCGKESSNKPSQYKKKKRHFCSMKCYSSYRKEILPKEEQHAYKGGGLPLDEKKKRIKARSDANHALRNGKIEKEPCSACGREDAHMHHADYEKPLIITWLCIKCHWEEHKIIYASKVKGLNKGE